jgi:hypothetical protein
MFSQIVLGQLGKDSLNYSLRFFNDRSLLNTFEKQLNTYNFNTIFSHNFVSDDFYFGVKENFKSTIINSSSKNIKDEQYFWAIGQYTFNDRLKTGILFNSDIYSDDRQIALNKASLLTSTFFAKYSPEKKIEITPFGGFSQNEQIGQKDNGYVYGTEANIDNYSLGDFELSSLLKFQNEDISPRKNTYRLVNFDINSSLEQTLLNTISANYSQQRKDFYFSADPVTTSEFNITNNIQSRTESSYYIQDRIRIVPQSSPLSIDMQGRVAWRGIDRNTRYISLSNIANTNYDTRIEESRLEFTSGADYVTENTNLAFRFSFSERDEKHTPEKSSDLNSLVYDERLQLETQKNNNSQLTNISLSGKINLSNSDKLTLSLFHRKLKYDTPSDANFDDRDELLSIGRIMYEKEFSPFFRVFVNLEGNINKIVYIFAERSSNNNIKRILKFSSGGLITNGNFSSNNSAEVSANYTVFDYEELNPNFRSYSFRQLALRDSSSFRFTRKIRLFFTGYLKFSEQGDFKWSNFTSNPVRYLSEQYAEPKIFYDYQELSLGVGIRYFSLSTFNYLNGTEKNKISDYSSIGPLSEISYMVGERIVLKIYGWYEFIKTDDKANREMVNLSMRLSYKF